MNMQQSKNDTLKELVEKPINPLKGVIQLVLSHDYILCM